MVLNLGTKMGNNILFLAKYTLVFFFFFEDNTIEFLFHRIEAYIKKRGAGDMFPAQQIPNPDNKAARGA